MAGIRDASCRTQWPGSLRRGSAAACLLRLRVRIPPGALTSVSCESRVLSGRGLCDGSIPRTQESYWVWCVYGRDPEAAVVRRPWPTRGCRAMGGGIWDAKFAELHVTGLVLLKGRKKQWCQWPYIYKGLSGEDIFHLVNSSWHMVTPRVREVGVEKGILMECHQTYHLHTTGSVAQMVISLLPTTLTTSLKTQHTPTTSLTDTKQPYKEHMR